MESERTPARIISADIHNSNEGGLGDGVTGTKLNGNLNSTVDFVHRKIVFDKKNRASQHGNNNNKRKVSMLIHRHTL